MTESHGDDGFVAFFRRYTRTWYHAVATAALTAFGLLTTYHRLFAAVAVASYVLPPVVLYLTGSLPDDANGSVGAGGADDRGADRGEPSAGAGATDPSAASRADGASPADDHETADERGSGTTGGDATDTTDSSDAESPTSPPGWTGVDTPTDESLADVAVADGRAYAVGGGGTVLADDGGGWTVALPDGPGAGSNALAGVDATPDAVWVAGENGAVGRLDAATGRHVDYSAPNGDTTNLAGVAAAAGHDGELVLLVDGSGRVRRGRYRDGEVSWDDPVTPGSGSSVADVTFVEESLGYLCDTNDGVYAVTDRGATVDRVGLETANGTLTGVAATGADACVVAADDGVAHRYDGTTWTPVSVADGPLWALAARDDRALAGGDGGVVYERAGDTADWERTVTPATVPLVGVALGETHAVAVGENGTVVER